MADRWLAGGFTRGNDVVVNCLTGNGVATVERKRSNRTTEDRSPRCSAIIIIDSHNSLGLNGRECVRADGQLARRPSRVGAKLALVH